MARANRLPISASFIVAGLLASRALAADPAANPPAESTSAQEVRESPHLTDPWLPQRATLEKQGVAIEIKYTSDYTRNLRGGLDTAGYTWRHLLDAAATLDTDPLLGLKGGSFFIDFQYAQGANASDELVGDLQGIDGLDGVPGAPHQNRTQLSQIWYQQSAFDGALRIKVGKVDANTEFDHSDVASEFLHQSTGSSATLFTLPTYPDPAFGFNVFFKPIKEVQIGFGIYDGSLAEGVRTGDRLAGAFSGGDDLFMIGEIDVSWSLGTQLPGRLGLGAWYSTNTFARFDGGQASGTGAPYAIFDQALWRANPQDEHDSRGLNLFLMYGYADPSILAYDHNIGGGLSWTGPIPGRSDDIVGVGVQAIHFSDAFQATARYEISYELFYRLQLKPWFAIKPDVQYISNPGGKGTPDALAVTLRFEVTF